MPNRRPIYKPGRAPATVPEEVLNWSIDPNQPGGRWFWHLIGCRDCRWGWRLQRVQAWPGPGGFPAADPLLESDWPPFGLENPNERGDTGDYVIDGDQLRDWWALVEWRLDLLDAERPRFRVSVSDHEFITSLASAPSLDSLGSTETAAAADECELCVQPKREHESTWLDVSDPGWRSPEDREALQRLGERVGEQLRVNLGVAHPNDAIDGPVSGTEEARRAMGLDLNRLCPGCREGDCYWHQYDYMNSEQQVRLCRCPDPDERHGKRRPKGGE